MLLPPITRSFSFFHSRFRRLISSKCRNSQMGPENLSLIDKRHRASFRLCNVSGYKTDLLEIHAKDPKFHVLFIPGNPGVISFYVDFLESLYDLLDGAASVTGKIQFHLYWTITTWIARFTQSRTLVKQKRIGSAEGCFHCKNKPITRLVILLAHTYLWTFFGDSRKRSRTLCTGLSSLATILALLPAWISRFLVKTSVGKSWSPPAVEALCKHVLRYHTIQNILYMAMTEFEKLSEVPDWSFMREKKSQMAFLFGVDDHWGPLHIYEEISNNVPGAVLAVERGGYTHAFSCTEVGSLWVAQHVSALINNYLSKH
ncbi:uncharacterized protein [Nicotiana tomentosiformis]|uniref:uncharacterized protein isoform X7 n=1 Tax=Nicotiana tomentosiformis TaxID=4098 RepID=UPI00051C531A|nr:uncharacterized protein LOC104121431 isoform X6 [Nicotiana tomentosiformis]